MDDETQPGLRERKKRETRARLQSTAARLFAEHGFDHVTISDIAAAAGVSPATVFNYFPTKDDLVFHGMAEYSRQLIDSLRSRETGTTVLDAFRDLALSPRGALASDDPAAMAGLLRIREIIAGSAALQARELLIAETMVDDLTGIIAEVEAEGLRPRFLAASLVGLIQTVTREIHRHARSGLTGTEVAEIVLPQARDALAIIERGLATA